MTTGNPHILPRVTLPKHIIQSPHVEQIHVNNFFLLMNFAPLFPGNAFSSRRLRVKVDTVTSPSFGLQACSKLPQQGHRELLVHLETGRFHIWMYRRYRR